MITLDLKKWLWIISIPALAVLLILGYLQVAEPAGFSAIIGTVLLILTLLPGLLMRVNILRENPYLRWLVKFRKDLGITAGTWLLTHGVISALFFFQRDQSILDQFLVLALKPVWFMIPLLAVMLLTSNEKSKTLLGTWWNRLHKLVWLLPPLMFFHGNLAIAEFEKEDFAPAGVMLALLVLLAIYDAIKTKTYARVALIVTGYLITVWLWMANMMP